LPRRFSFKTLENSEAIGGSISLTTIETAWGKLKPARRPLEIIFSASGSCSVMASESFLFRELIIEPGSLRPIKPPTIPRGTELLSRKKRA